MLAALESGAIGHAGLDVLHAEPLKSGPSAHAHAERDVERTQRIRTQEAPETLLRRAIDIVRDIVK